MRVRLGDRVAKTDMKQEDHVTQDQDQDQDLQKVVLNSRTALRPIPGLERNISDMKAVNVLKQYVIILAIHSRLPTNQGEIPLWK